MNATPWRVRAVPLGVEFARPRSRTWLLVPWSKLSPLLAAASRSMNERRADRRRQLDQVRQYLALPVDDTSFEDGGFGAELLDLVNAGATVPVRDARGPLSGGKKTGDRIAPAARLCRSPEPAKAQSDDAAQRSRGVGHRPAGNTGRQPTGFEACLPLRPFDRWRAAHPRGRCYGATCACVGKAR